MDRANPGSVAERAVFLFAHQDDEYAAFDALERSVRNGARPICIYLTDGGSRQTARRNAESLTVLRALGVSAGDVRFVGCEEQIPDGKLHHHLEAAYRSIAEVVHGRGRVGALFIPAWEGGHQDHDAVHLIGVALASDLGILGATWQFSLYHGAGLPWVLFRVLSPLAENGDVVSWPIAWRKRLLYASYCLAYRSQVKTWIGLFPFVLTDLMIAGVQRLQTACPGRLAHRPHAGPLLYERRGWLLHKDFRAVVAPFLEAHISVAMKDT
jgi:LmbE family N-acetylglucosaminyl deacetylase